MKKVNNYLALVDYYKPLRLKHRTAGAYRVGAKNEKEAKRFVEQAIGFGSVQIIDQFRNDDAYYVPYRMVKRKHGNHDYRPVVPATAPLSKHQIKT